MISRAAFWAQCPANDARIQSTWDQEDPSQALRSKSFRAWILWNVYLQEGDRPTITNWGPIGSNSVFLSIVRATAGETVYLPNSDW
jgi:hypothetical protein